VLGAAITALFVALLGIDLIALTARAHREADQEMVAAFRARRSGQRPTPRTPAPTPSWERQAER
jgi:hypothetical protein